MPSRNQFGPAGLSIPRTEFARGGRGSPGTPILEAYIELPAMLDPSSSGRSRANRVHSKAINAALEATMQKHHKTRIWQHFDRIRQKKYRYKKRSEGTIEIRKRRRKPTDRDLHKTGKSKRSMTQRMQIKVSGTGGAGIQRKVVGTMKWKSGMKVAQNAKVTRKDMSEEIAKFSLDEEREAAQDLVHFYLLNLDDGLKSDRVRRRLAGRLASMGLSV